MLPGTAPAGDQAIPVAAFFRHPMVTDLVISPNGEHFSAILASEGDQYLTMYDFRGATPKPLLKTENPDFRIDRVVWGNDDLLLISMSMKSKTSVGVRARSTRLFSLPREGGQLPKYLAEKWPGAGDSQFQDQFLSFLRNDPEHVLLQYRSPQRKWPQPVRLNLDSGKLSSWGRLESDVYWWYATANGDVRVGAGFVESSRTWNVVVRSADSDEFQVVNERRAGDASFSFAGYSADPAHIYVVSDQESGRDALYVYDFKQQAFVKTIYSNDRVDVSSLLYFETRDEPYAVAYILDALEYEFLDTGLGLELQMAAKQIGRTLDIVSASADGQQLILVASDDTHPPEYWGLDRKARRLGKLAEAYPDLAGETFQPMRPISFEARDGVKLSGYLTVPAAGTDQPWPTIVLVHGGPGARDFIEWSQEVQFFANRGYAVLQINFRGSAGFGRALQAAGDGQWGLSMQDDITDGTQWLIDQGVADARRICIYGASYGGYAAMMGLIRSPDLFRCGASYAGVMDLIGLLKDDDWYAGGRMIREHIGDPRDDAERLKHTSPINNIDKIRVPVFLAHGEYDDRVHVSQTEKMTKALKQAGKPVESHIYPLEIHGFKEEDNRIEFYTALIGFFDRNLAAASEDAASSP